MGASGNLDNVKIRYGNAQWQARPFFIDAQGWDAFENYVWGGMGLPEIADMMNTSIRHVRQMIADVDQRLSVPRRGIREWSEITLESPLEDLQLSVRARNRLHDLGCTTVADVCRLNLSAARIGRGSREEVAEALRRYGLWDPSSSALEKAADLERINAQVQELRDRIDENVRHWRSRVDGLEARLKRISQNSM
jgi:hypothetical protein